MLRQLSKDEEPTTAIETTPTRIHLTFQPRSNSHETFISVDCGRSDGGGVDRPMGLGGKSADYYSQRLRFELRKQRKRLHHSRHRVPKLFRGDEQDIRRRDCSMRRCRLIWISYHIQFSHDRLPCGRRRLQCPRAYY